MKKIIAVLCIFLALFLSGCNSEERELNEAKNNLNKAISDWCAQDVETGFEKALK